VIKRGHYGSGQPAFRDSTTLGVGMWPTDDIARVGDAPSQPRDNPDEEQLATLAGGTFFGEQTLLTAEPSDVTYRAIDHAEVYSIGRDSFLEIFGEMKTTDGTRHHPIFGTIYGSQPSRARSLTQELNAKVTKPRCDCEHAQVTKPLEDGCGTESGCSCPGMNGASANSHVPAQNSNENGRCGNRCTHGHPNGGQCIGANGATGASCGGVYPCNGGLCGYEEGQPLDGLPGGNEDSFGGASSQADQWQGGRESRHSSFSRSSSSRCSGGYDDGTMACKFRNFFRFSQNDYSALGANFTGGGSCGPAEHINLNATGGKRKKRRTVMNRLLKA